MSHAENSPNVHGWVLRKLVCDVLLRAHALFSRTSKNRDWLLFLNDSCSPQLWLGFVKVHFQDLEEASKLQWWLVIEIILVRNILKMRVYLFIFVQYSGKGSNWLKLSLMCKYNCHHVLEHILYWMEFSAEKEASSSLSAHCKFSLLYIFLNMNISRCFRKKAVNGDFYVALQ